MGGKEGDSLPEKRQSPAGQSTLSCSRRADSHAECRPPPHVRLERREGERGREEEDRRQKEGEETDSFCYYHEIRLDSFIYHGIAS